MTCHQLNPNQSNPSLNPISQPKPRSREERTKFRLTPSHGTELEDVGGNVDVEDLDECEVHVDGLQAHPGERGEQEVVQRCSGGYAQPVVGEGREPGVEKEKHAQPQQGGRQVDEYLGWVVSTQLPEVSKNNNNQEQKDKWQARDSI